ncbi:MAG TPA: alpha/beta hydrolase [Acidobacteriota bacterium]|jgi:3-oxoadipate enol-lactonase
MKSTINGTPLFYEVSGNPAALPVVFIHGFPFSCEMWSGQVAAVQDQYCALTYDVRGHGQSNVGDGQYTIELFVDDLIALIDYLKMESAVLVGLSMGGYIALRALERNPERVRAAVLCDSRSEADSNEAKLKRAAGIASVKKHGAAAFADQFVKGVFAARTFEHKPELVDRIRRVIAGMSPLAIAGTLLALAARTDTTESLPRIKAPTMILVGEQDAITPFDAARAMHQKIPNSELHVIPRAAHMSNLENPEVFNEKLLLFLRRVS